MKFRLFVPQNQNLRPLQTIDGFAPLWTVDSFCNSNRSGFYDEISSIFQLLLLYKRIHKFLNPEYRVKLGSQPIR